MEGHTGRLCRRMQAGWYSLGGVWDLECGEWGKVATVAATVAVALAWYIIHHFAVGDYDALTVVRAPALIPSLSFFLLSCPAHRTHPTPSLATGSLRVGSALAVLTGPWNRVGRFSCTCRSSVCAGLHSRPFMCCSDIECERTLTGSR